ncbi:hypothetical protein PTTG_29610 [Puccinia triticina 1-1 BBBD Race 1]|uniref:Uncharacterized protein n=1 Tax=Puccinia triticina (isolate 1-1 / race 1 (BBBD)) TaxID=630390 RepID=A0A180G592_PUCT1|nr:hypothetical protein PTTG_29610 [Puccinia triticina 1-1 BBBD Race 1]
MDVYYRFIEFKSSTNPTSAGVASKLKDLAKEWNNLKVNLTTDVFMGFVLQSSIGSDSTLKILTEEWNLSCKRPATTSHLRSTNWFRYSPRASFKMIILNHLPNKSNPGITHQLFYMRLPNSHPSTKRPSWRKSWNRNRRKRWSSTK